MLWLWAALMAAPVIAVAVMIVAAWRAVGWQDPGLIHPPAPPSWVTQDYRAMQDGQ